MSYLPSTQIPITADSWFSNLGWLESSPTPTTLAMKKKSHSPLFRVITHNLRPKEYRVFTNGKVVVSIFHSDQILKVASTAFTVVGDISPNLPSPHLVDLPPAFPWKISTCFQN
jgi:hypothetical protein